MPRAKPTKPTRKMKQDALKALHRIVESSAPGYVQARAAVALLNNGREPDGALPGADPDAPRTIIFLPKKGKHPGQRDDESMVEWDARIKVKAEARRAAYCEHIGLPYDPMRPLPCWPWPVPGSDPDWEDEVDRRVAEAEAAEIERQRAHPRREPVEVLGPREDAPGVIIFDSRTEAGRADCRRWKAEAIAAGHAIIGPQ
jgi:hypothetical protein